MMYMRLFWADRSLAFKVSYHLLVSIEATREFRVIVYDACTASRENDRGSTRGISQSYNTHIFISYMCVCALKNEKHEVEIKIYA